jgi:glycosyltransferase involved in cell wall biosynthesis
MPALPNNTPPMRLDFLGASDSPWARELIAQYAGTPLAPNLRFLGNVRDVYERVYAADVLVLGSRAEAFPLVVLEAMALGVCVVAPDIDGVREQVIDESTGLLFARDNARELVGCLSRVARDGRLRERFGAAGRARYLERFTRERQLARWSSALQWMRGGS